MKKTALVTGVAGGIGFETAKKLLDSGINVMGMDIAPNMNKTLDGEFTYFCGDLSNRDDRESFVNAAINKYGKMRELMLYCK